MDSDFRPPRPNERELLGKLLEGDFPGREELCTQLESVTVKEIDEDGSLALAVASGPKAPVRHRVPTEGMCPDGDGKMVFVLLHVVNGTMNELEIFKEDGSKILRPPAARDLNLFRPGPI